jgi:outer membrane murein-binding lipoprotein Lpp
MNLSGLQMNKQTKILAVIFAVLIVYVDTSYILKAQSAGLKRLDSRIAKLNTDLANLNRGLEDMRASKGAPKKNNQPSKIIFEGQVAVLLQDISTQANKLKIKIVQMSPLKPAQKDKSTAAQSKITPLLINLDKPA